MYVKMKGIFFKGSDWGRPLAGQINTECKSAAAHSSDHL
jgi:hypothetical protein